MGLAALSTLQVTHIFREGKHFVKGLDGKEYEHGTKEEQLAYIPPRPPKPTHEPSLQERIVEQKDMIIQNATHFLTIKYLFESSYGFTPKYLWHQDNRYLVDPANGQTENSNHALYTKLLKKAKEGAIGNLAKRLDLLELEKEEYLPEAIEEELKTVFFNQINELREKTIEKIQSTTIDDEERPFRSFFSEIATEVEVLALRILYFGIKQKAKILYFIFNRVIQFYVKRLVSVHLDMLVDYKERIRKDNFCLLKNEFINNLITCLSVLNKSYKSITNDTVIINGAKKDRIIRAIPIMIGEELRKEASNNGKTPDTLYKEFATTLIVSTLGSIKGHITSWLLRRFIQPEDIVQKLVQTIIASAKDNEGFSHPMKTLLLKKLKQIEELLKNQKPALTLKNSLKDKNFVSDERKKQLETIIAQVLELIYKSQCKSTQELSALIAGNTSWNLKAEQFAMPYVMNHLVLMISDLIEFNVNEIQIDQLTLQVLKLTNESFMPMTPPTTEERTETETQLEKTTQNILSIAIDKGVKDIPIEEYLGVLYPYAPDLGKFIGIKTQPDQPPLTRLQRIKKTIESYWRYARHPIETNAQEAMERARTFAIEQSKKLVEKGIEEAKAQIHTNATKRVSDLYDLITQQNTYLCAIHHLLLIPHVKAMNKEIP